MAFVIVRSSVLLKLLFVVNAALSYMTLSIVRLSLRVVFLLQMHGRLGLKSLNDAGATGRHQGSSMYMQLESGFSKAGGVRPVVFDHRAIGRDR